MCHRDIFPLSLHFLRVSVLRSGMLWYGMGMFVQYSVPVTPLVAVTQSQPQRRCGVKRKKFNGCQRVKSLSQIALFNLVAALL